MVMAVRASTQVAEASIMGEADSSRAEGTAAELLLGVAAKVREEAALGKVSVAGRTSGEEEVVKETSAILMAETLFKVKVVPLVVTTITRDFVRIVGVVVTRIIKGEPLTMGIVLVMVQISRGGLMGTMAAGEVSNTGLGLIQMEG
jgi:hypothetical protein